MKNRMKQNPVARRKMRDNTRLHGNARAPVGLLPHRAGDGEATVGQTGRPRSKARTKQNRASKRSALGPKKTLKHASFADDPVMKRWLENRVMDAKVEMIKTAAKNLFGMNVVEVKLAHEPGRGPTEEEVRPYEERMTEERARHADELLSALIDTPEFRALAMQKLPDISRRLHSARRNPG